MSRSGVTSISWETWGREILSELTSGDCELINESLRKNILQLPTRKTQNAWHAHNFLLNFPNWFLVDQTIDAALQIGLRQGNQDTRGLQWFLRTWQRKQQHLPPSHNVCLINFHQERIPENWNYKLNTVSTLVDQIMVPYPLKFSDMIVTLFKLFRRFGFVKLIDLWCESRNCSRNLWTHRGTFEWK